VTQRRPAIPPELNIYTYIYTNKCTQLYIKLYAYVNIYIYIYLHIHMDHKCIYTYINIYICIYPSTTLSVYLQRQRERYICRYRSACVYTYTHTY